MEKPPIEIYDDFDPDHEVIRLYNPKYLGKGGDHLVFEIAEHPNIVVKASTFKIKDILSDDSGFEIGKKNREIVETEIDQKNQKSKNLIKYFGAEHVLNERRYLMKVPVTPEILENIYKNDWEERVPPPGFKNIKEVWTVVVIQKKSEMVDHPGVLSFNFGGLLENFDIDSSIVAKINETTLTDKVLNMSDVDLVCTSYDLMCGGNISKVFDLFKDEEFKIFFKELIKKIIYYTKDTGNILALAGYNNLVITKENHLSKWNYELLDVLPIHQEEMFTLSKMVIVRFFAGEQINKHEKTILIKTLNFVRVINTFAKSLGVEDCLKILPQEVFGLNKLLELKN